MYDCQSCNRTFASDNACWQHMNALDHWAKQYECDFCTDRFYNQDDCDDHMDDYGHHRWECDTCTKKFSSSRAKDQHMDAAGHWEHYCAPCKRRFGDNNQLRMHLNSRIHQGATVPCPFCRKAFTTASGFTNHLEKGSCPNARALNRETIYQAIRQRDRNGIFTNNLLEWHEETWSPNNAWNGNDFECYICRHVFGTMRGLDQHLKSPTHQQEIYHCPNKARCRKQFKNLAGMFNHLESESCGFTKFGSVNKSAEDFFTGGSAMLIGFR
ncbi:hypothetical protein MMC14_010734 [Varicellaria rhodocarpa]|nr:hypothetical protein [Varicellaria rhodocarpa]